MRRVSAEKLSWSSVISKITPSDDFYLTVTIMTVYDYDYGGMNGFLYHSRFLLD